MSVNYLNDFLISILSYWQIHTIHAWKISKLPKNLLEELGFIINNEKSCLVPALTCKFLGFIVNSSDMTIDLPVENTNHKTLGKMVTQTRTIQ